MREKSAKVTVKIGDFEFTSSVELGWGDNPAFYGIQLDDALDTLSRRGWQMIAAQFGVQSIDRPLNDPKLGGKE